MELEKELLALANKYETSDFLASDPSQFIRWYTSPKDIEVASLIAAMLSFGNRKQFIPKIREIFTLADSILDKNQKSLKISQWCLAGAPNFPTGTKKFYRFYSYDDLHIFFKEIAEILKTAPTLGEYFQQIYEGKRASSLAFPWAQPESSPTPSSGFSRHPQRPLHLAQIISASFPESAIVPKGKNSANKRIHMYLRWMVRQNSPVDIGLWTWYSPAELLIPLDVHVMQEAIKLKLLPENSKASYKTALELTNKMAEIFPSDPVRSDFALFGLGIN